MKVNEASWDRAVRLILAVALGAAAVAVGGAVAVVLVALALVMVVTGASGRCPIYQVAGVSTCPSDPPEG